MSKEVEGYHATQLEFNAYNLFLVTIGCDFLFHLTSLFQTIVTRDLLAHNGRAFNHVFFLMTNEPSNLYMGHT